MKNTNSNFLLILLLIFCLQKAKSQTNEYHIEKIVIGDINNDKITDTAFVKGPKFINDSDGWGDCKKSNCQIVVSFSCNLPSVTLENAVSGFVENIGDIDNNGISEIIIVPSWFVGCWGQIHFYSKKSEKWKNIGNAKRNICGDESFMKYIKKLKGSKIQVLEQLWLDGDVVEKPKIISVK